MRVMSVLWMSTSAPATSPENMLSPISLTPAPRVTLVNLLSDLTIYPPKDAMFSNVNCVKAVMFEVAFLPTVTLSPTPITLIVCTASLANAPSSTEDTYAIRLTGP